MSGERSHALASSWQGALAGGGDPASSPLYVFGPFLTLVAGAGVARVTFGTSIWLAVLTIAVVSLLYRLVMRWIVDGSGGTGLAEEELGPWAAKITAALTCIEYTLTFLVSIAALVTFVADRAGLDGSTLGISHKSLCAVGTSVVCAFLVSSGPRVVSRVVGPATAGVLLLLWVMIVAVLIERGLHLPSFRLDAFRGRYLGFTLGGFVRILALMTGIEVFANLVASYAGPPAERSRKAFTSLAIIMGSTALTMSIVGPAILASADPTDPDVSVFTQTMDALLPRPLALAGTGLGVLVLLAAAAASALGIASLFQGLSIRHYAPAAFAVRNRVGVAARPVWAEAGVAALLFVLLGTEEATYLSIYAAGVFVLLSMTGWSAVLRLRRRRRTDERATAGVFVSVVAAAVFTTVATVVLFYERFGDGVWLYGVLVPVLALGFAAVRRMRGEPGALADRMGRLVSNRGPGAVDQLAPGDERHPDDAVAVVERLEGDAADPRRLSSALVYRIGGPVAAPWRVCVPLDGSATAEQALAFVVALGRVRPLDVHLVHVEEVPGGGPAVDYLDLARAWVADHVDSVACHVIQGESASAVLAHVEAAEIDVLLMTTHGRTGIRRAISGSVTRQVLEGARRPVVAVTPTG